MRCRKDCWFCLRRTAKYGIVNRQEKYCFAPWHDWVVRSGWLRDRDLPARGRRSAVQAFDRLMAWQQRQTGFQTQATAYEWKFRSDSA
jgi:hypothetical protein